jgi:hypothetical protein
MKRATQRIDVFATLTRIEFWRRLAMQLALMDGITDRALLRLMNDAMVPVELRPGMRAAVGRHWRYRIAPGLSAADQRQLAVLTAKGDNRSRKDLSAQLRLQRKWHGRLGHQINLSILTGSPAAGVATGLRKKTPGYLKRLWQEFDAWGAQQHNTSVRSLRRWRLAATRSDDPLLQTLGRRRISKAERHVDRRQR